ncbi:MAG: hypothetical protein JNJ60_20420, partial [Rhodocyclaceae bacterium]|nr:hypothetical protein [Rhodocyclaceae bacterium]
MRGTQSGTILMCGATGCNAAAGNGVNFATIVADTPGRSITIQGTNWTNSGSLRAAGGTLTTSGAWSLGATGSLALQSGALRLGGTFPSSSLRVNRTDTDGLLAVVGTVENTGSTLVVDASLGNLTLGDASLYTLGFIQGGRVEINGGAFTFSYGGFNNVTLGSDLTIGEGSSLRVQNTLTLDNSAHIILQGGASGTAFVLPGGGQGSQFTIDGTGSILLEASRTNRVGDTSIGSMTLGSGITVRGSQSGTIGIGSGENRATIIADSGNSISLNGSAWANSGELRVTNGSISASGLSANSGTVNVAAGMSASLTGSSWTNSGVMNISGSLTTAGFASNALGGAVAIANGGSWSTSDTAFANNGSIALSGTLDLTAGATKRTLTNNGTVTVSGMAAVDGNLSQGSAGQLQFNIAGNNRGADYDALDVSGSMTFNGALRVTQAAGYTPANGDMFRLIRYGSRSGTSVFSSLSIPATGGYVPFYGTGNFVLGINVAGLNEWRTDSSGTWQTAGNWSLGHVPLASEAVIIDRVSANPTVTLSSGAQSAAGLFSGESIALSAGSLTVSGSANLSSVSLSAGALNLGGATTLVSLNQSGGTLTGSGDLSLSGSSTWSGGTWSGAGSTTVASGATLSLIGSPTLAGRNLANAGTTTVNGSVELDGTQSLNNSGTLILQIGSMGDGNASPGSLSLTNAAGASLTKTGGGSFALNASLTNSGSLDVQSGSLSVPGFSSNPGSINIAAGASLSNGGSALNNSGALNLSGGTLTSGALSNSGSVAGSGTLDLGGATFSNDGTLSPGGAGATGTLTIL